MNKISVISLIVFLAYNISSAQITFQVSFGGTSDDEGYSVQQTSDSGYIVVGVNSSFGAGDVYLIKTDINGDTLWTKTYGGNNDDVAKAVHQTTDGGYIVAGYTLSFGAGDYDVYLIKTNANGDMLWTKTYGRITGYEKGNSVQQTTDGGFIVAGFTDSLVPANKDVFLVKTDSVGDTLWTKTYGGNNDDVAEAVRQTLDEGYIIAGRTNSFGEGSYDGYLIKTDSIGDTLWTKTYGGVSFDYFNSIQQTADGGYIIAGYTQSFGVGGGDVYLVKTNTIGDTLWTKTYGGTNADFGEFVQQTTDGGYIITGGTGSFGGGNYDIYLIKTNSVGDTLWTKTYGDIIPTNIGYSVRPTIDDGFIIAGYRNGPPAGNKDVYLIKTDSIGNSGCKQSGTNTIVGNTATVVSSTATIVGSGAIVSNTATIVGNTVTVITDVCDTTIGINEQLIPTSVGKQITVYPNPAHDALFITGNFDVPATFELYDITGRKVLSQSINSNQPININQLSKGLYLYLLNADNKAIARGKVVIE